MLIDTEEIHKSKHLPLPDIPHATSSTSAFDHSPPTFEESAADHVLQFSQDHSFTPLGGEAGEEPPPFLPYNAQFFSSHSGDIISHDPHLNLDGTLQLVLMSSCSKLFQARPCTVSCSHKHQRHPLSYCDAEARITKLTRG